MKRLLILSLCLLTVSACKSPYSDPSYKHQTKQLNTPYTDWKEDREAAEKVAMKELDFYATDECRRMSYGWYLKEIKDKGEMTCEESAEGFHCKHKNVSLLCEQLDES